MIRRILGGNRESVNTTPNTFIGGVAAIVPNASTLATRLGINVSNISYFSVIGNNIEASVGVPYSVFANGWTGITYWVDADSLAEIGNKSDLFLGQSTFKYALFLGTTGIIGNQAFRSCDLRGTVRFPSVTNIKPDSFHFYNNPNMKRLYLPICTQYGGSVISNSIFIACNSLQKIYCHPSMLTVNAGGLEGDLAYAQNTLGTTIVAVQNFTPPSAITNLSHSGGALNFTPPSSANGIDFYEVFVDKGDGNIINKYFPFAEITASGATVIGLATGDKVYVMACDIYYNRSKSNEITL